MQKLISLSIIKRLLKDIAPLVRPQWLLIVCGLLAAVVSALALLAIPWSIKTLLRSAIVNNQLTLLVKILLGILACLVILVIANFFHRFLMAYAGERIILRLRSNFYRKLLCLPYSYFTQAKTGELVARFTADVGLIERFLVGNIVNMIKQPLVVIGAICLLFKLHLKLALLSLLTAPAIVYAIIKCSKRIHKLTYSFQQRLADVVSKLEETIRNIYTVKINITVNKACELFERVYKNYFVTKVKSQKVQAIIDPAVELLCGLGGILVIAYGSYEVMVGNLGVDSLVAFILYVATLSGPLQRLAQLNLELQQAHAAIVRINEVMNEKEQLYGKSVSLCKAVGRVDIEDVSFAYDNFKLQNISLHIDAGETIAIVGASGSGKTTLANLIIGLYRPQRGRILIDGKDITEIDIHELHNQVTIVPQEVHIFNGTIIDNITYGLDSYDLASVVDAARIAHAAEFIERLPQGYFTQIGERGLYLSAGQRQRIGIARAILRKSKILILDEATSNVDLYSEALIAKAIDNISTRQTTIVIVHRISSVSHFNKIVVMDKGRIVAIGNHKKLLDECAIYRRLFFAQFREKCLSEAHV